MNIIPLYSRVRLYYDGIEYRPASGAIRNLRINLTYNDSQAHGNTPDGSSSGVVYGNYDGTVSWEEYLDDETDYTNFRALVLANPSALLTVVPVSISTAVPAAPSFVLGKLGGRALGIVNSDVNAAVMRDTDMTFGYFNYA